MKKRVLVLGATGAMGIYLVPELLKKGFAVDAVSLDKMVSDHPDLTWKTANAKDDEVLKELLAPHYDCIVDFMMYPTPEIQRKHRLLLDSTDHYIYLSSYRVYADSPVIREDSPRLLDVSTDDEYLASDDYSLYKARGEDILRASGRTNWTFVRPAITYSKRRFQLVTLEAMVVIRRAMEGKTVILPETAMGIQATMSWGGDIARLIAGLVCNEKAKGEVYTLATAEHHTWRTIAEYYKELIGLKYVIVPEEVYLSLWADDPFLKNTSRWQLDYDRKFNRICDNSKVLAVTSITQESFTSLKDGLRRELEALPRDVQWEDSDLYHKMDKLTETLGL